MKQSSYKGKSPLPDFVIDAACADEAALRLLREDVLSGGAPVILADDAVSEIFLDNLKTATPWLTKQANIRLLTDFARSGVSPVLHIATHLSNLIKVSDRVTVRHSAGNALLELAPRLTADQRNEVAVELCRGLELGQQEFTKYIPDYLGRFMLWLPPAELDELLDDLWVNLSAADSRVAASVLDTVGVVYEAYDTYRTRFPEADEAYRRRRQRLLGMLMRGLYGIDDAVRQEALYVLGRRVFGSAELGDHEKCRAFVLTERKLLDYGTLCRPLPPATILPRHRITRPTCAPPTVTPSCAPTSSLSMPPGRPTP